MAFQLNDDEVRALRWALDNYLPELRYDEARVKLMRDRHDVVVIEETLSRLRERLPSDVEPPLLTADDLP
jgi:hypothetical protein